MQTDWNGFPCEEFEFKRRKAVVVFPRCAGVGKLLLKTEYWGVFPDVGLQLLERGGHHPHGLIKSNAPIVEFILAHS